MMREVLAVLTAAILAIKPIGAQPDRDTLFRDLRADGNNIGALKQPIRLTTTSGTAEALMRRIAADARLNITFDVTASGRLTEVAVTAESRTAASLLLLVAAQARLQVRVSASGQLIVLAAPPVRAEATRPEPSPVVTLPPVRAEALQFDRERFESSANPSTLTISGQQLRTAPVFVEPDVLRSIQTMPGVQARSDYAAGFNIRGGEADQTVVMMDGYPIYNPYHLGGVFSTFIDRAVGRVELFRGNLPVHYGGRLSGVLDVRSAEPTNSDLGGSADVSLVSTSATVGKSLADSSGAWMVAARRTYADVLLNFLQPGAFPYHFQDAQAHATKTIRGAQFAVTAYDGLDAAERTGGSRTRARWGNGLLGVTARRPLVLGADGDSLVWEQRASLSSFDSRVDISTLAFTAADHVRELRLGGSLAYRRPRTSTTLGYDASFTHLTYASTSPLNPFTDFLPFDAFSQDLKAGGVFAEELWRPRHPLIVTVGARFDMVNAGAGETFSPRLTLKYLVGSSTAITAGAGRASQWMHSLGREEEPIQPLQFWIASDSLRPISMVNDATLGVEHWLSARTLLHVESFHKEYRNLLVPNLYNDPSTPGDEFFLAAGTSYGLDLLLRRFDGPGVSGWIAYTYAMNSRRRADGSAYIPGQDRRHNLNIVATWRTEHYVLSARANVASGFPTTPVLGEFVRDRYDPQSQRWAPDESGSDRQTILDGVNSRRLPLYRRVDLGVTRPTLIRGVAVSPYLSIVNVLNAHNPAAYVYDFTVKSDRMSIPNLPFAPTFGVSVVF